jgi:hypothetical protein
MDRRPMLPLGRWAPVVLGVVALALLVWGAIQGNREMVVIGAVAAAALLLAYPLAERLLGTGRHEDE